MNPASDTESRPPRDPVLGVSWIVLGGLYTAWIASQVAGEWTDLELRTRFYYAVALLSGVALTAFGAWQIRRPFEGRSGRILLVALPAVITANHLAGILGNLLLCLSPG
jgi:hypothetical protein